MVKLALQVKTTLECVDKLYTCHPDYGWVLRLRCGACNEPAEKACTITESEVVPLRHNRSTTHLLVKCKLCSKENTIGIVEGSNGVYTGDDSGKFKTMVILDCRGVEPTEFVPSSGWIVESSENGRKFEDVDLSEKEWVEYDDKNNTSVGIYELESRFVKVK